MLNPILVKLADDIEKTEKEPESAGQMEGGEINAQVPASSPVNPAAVMDFLAQQGQVDDKAFHSFCEQNGFDVDQAESVAYGLAQKCMQLLREGKSAGVDPNQFDPQQIEMGMQIELEHTNCPVIRKKIVFDHLAEDPQYYSQEYMQKELQSENGEEQAPISEKVASLLIKVAKKKRETNKEWYARKSQDAMDVLHADDPLYRQIQNTKIKDPKAKSKAQLMEMLR